MHMYVHDCPNQSPRSPSPNRRHPHRDATWTTVKPPNERNSKTLSRQTEQSGRDCVFKGVSGVTRRAVMTARLNSEKNFGPSAEEAAAVELVRMAKEQGLSLTGTDGLLKQFTKSVLKTALNEEMTEHLGDEKGRADRGRGSARGYWACHDRITQSSRWDFRTADREEAPMAVDRCR